MKKKPNPNVGREPVTKKAVIVNHRVTVTEERVINLSRMDVQKILAAWFNLDLNKNVQIDLVIIVNGSPVDTFDEFEMSIVANTTNSSEQEVPTEPMGAI